MALVTCPTCKRTLDWSSENKWRPFCSERCKLIDLGNWAAEKNVISTSAGANENDLDENLDEPTPPIKPVS